MLSAICLFTLSDKGEFEQHETTGSEITLISETPAEMMSVLTINTIYRQGGFDAVQRHFEKTNEMKGSRQRQTITLCDILAELNGNGYDRRQL